MFFILQKLNGGRRNIGQFEMLQYENRVKYYKIISEGKVVPLSHTFSIQSPHPLEYPCDKDDSIIFYP